MFCYDFFETPLGTVTAASDDEGLSLLEFTVNDKPSHNLATLALINGTSPLKQRNSHLDQLGRELEEYFSGSGREFRLPLSITSTPFRKQVWSELMKIPYGQTRSYLNQAVSMGKPEAVRAVARANGANMISIIIPCHRVVGSNGKLTGYGGGLWRKKWLLEHEGNYSKHPSHLLLF